MKEKTNEREMAMLHLAVISASIIKTRWWEFKKRNKLSQKAQDLADKWMIDY